MRKDKIILTDVDGTIIDWESGYNDFMAKKGHVLVENTESKYSMAEKYGITVQQTRSYIKEFNEGPLIADLLPFKDSAEYMSKLSDYGFRFIAVTSISDHSDALKYRTENLLKVFGCIFDDILCLEMGISKYNTLMQWSKKGYFWVEDHRRQAEVGYEAGLMPILIDHHYNNDYMPRLFPKVSCTTPWFEIYRIITGHYGI